MAPAVPEIVVHSSVEEAALDREAIAALRANRIDPKFLYITPHQAELWRQVFLHHSPIHGNPDFIRIYRESFAATSRNLGDQKILLVGLGCGTGRKELDLCSSLAGKVLFTAIDVSCDLVMESVGQLIAAGADHQRSLVCDLAEVEFIGRWLDDLDGTLPRVITFFGLFPNFPPSVVTRLFRAISRPGDRLLASAHLVLVPEGKEEEISAAMKAILPQYDNAETLAWLGAALELWELEELVHSPEIEIGEIEGVPAFIGTARWRTNEPFVKWGVSFLPQKDESLRLFYSLRYTPALFEKMLRREGFDPELLSITICRQEAVWCIRRG